MKKHFISKRILTILLALMLLLAALPSGVFAQSFQMETEDLPAVLVKSDVIQPATILPPENLGGQDISITAVPSEEIPLKQDEAAVVSAFDDEIFYVNGIENGGNLRSTPNASNDSNTIICIENGQRVEKISQTGNWLYVSYYIVRNSDGMPLTYYGYMHNSVLLPDGQKIIMANSDTSDKLLNMRSYPNGPIIGTIPNDHCMLYDDSNPKSGNWQQVVYNGKTGYVYTPLTKKATVTAYDVSIWEGSSSFILYDDYGVQEGDVFDVSIPFKREFQNGLKIDINDNGNIISVTAVEEMEVTKLIFGQE